MNEPYTIEGDLYALHFSHITMVLTLKLSDLVAGKSDPELAKRDLRASICGFSFFVIYIVAG